MHALKPKCIHTCGKGKHESIKDKLKGETNICGHQMGPHISTSHGKETMLLAEDIFIGDTFKCGHQIHTFLQLQ